MVINTDADVIRVIRENPRLVFQALREDDELLDEVRRLVLTEEILAMPGQLAEVIETQNAMLKTQEKVLADQAEMRQNQNEMLVTQTKILADQAEMRQNQNEMLVTQTKILADQAEMRQTQNEMLETQTKILADQAEMRQTQNEILKNQTIIFTELADLKKEHDETRRVQERMESVQNRMDGRLGNLYGADLERRLPRLLPSRLFGMLKLHRPAVLLRDAVEPDREFLARIQDATSEGVIPMRDYDRLIDTDLILRARFRESGEIVFCAAEASGVIDGADVNRAIDSARILNVIYGERTVPVVAGYSVTERAQALADALEVVVVILNQR